MYLFLLVSPLATSSRAKCPIRSLSSVDESERIGHLAREDDIFNDCIKLLYMSKISLNIDGSIISTLSQ